MSLRHLAALAALVLLSSTAVSAQSTETGYASWYNGGFHGLATSSGEPYDHEAMTAAHPSLPYGTLVRVTRVDDSGTVTVRVNDRMKSGPGHVIDLSGRAARELGMLESGVAKVRVDVVSGAVAYRSEPAAEVRTVSSTVSVPISWSAESGSGFTLQLGVFSSVESAQRLAADFEDAWIQAVETDSGRLYRVYFERFDAEQSARDAQARLWTAGQESFLRRF